MNCDLQRENVIRVIKRNYIMENYGVCYDCEGRIVEESGIKAKAFVIKAADILFFHSPLTLSLDNIVIFSIYFICHI